MSLDRGIRSPRLYAAAERGLIDNFSDARESPYLERYCLKVIFISESYTDCVRYAIA